MPGLLGIDCGGTSTRAVFVVDGEQTWTSSAGPANASTSASPEAAITSALACSPTPDAVCAALAGLVTAAQREHIEALLKSHFPKAAVTAVPDYEAALSSCNGLADVCVIAGTGSLVCSRGASGDSVCSGGRGYLLGDEGSAFQYGRDALLHFLDSPPDDVSSRLRDAVAAAFGTTKKGEVIEALYASPEIPSRVASLCEPLSQDADEQRIYALKSIRIHCAKLAHVVSRHIRSYLQEADRVTVGCHGGVWAGAAMRQTFQQQLPVWCRVEAHAVFDLPPPVIGAVKLAGGLL
jgi:N-acetylglucosamine kinase-like BadF-type ATPase